MRAAFSDVRKRLLPDIVTTRYSVAKSAFDRKDYASAEQVFRQVIALLDDPDMGGRLSDLRTLASGFLDLRVAAAAPPPEPAKKEPVAAPAPPPVPQADPNRVYTMEDSDVTPPVAVRQDVPRIPPSLALQARDHGVLDVTIDERGRVISLTVAPVGAPDVRHIADHGSTRVAVSTGHGCREAREIPQADSGQRHEDGLGSRAEGREAGRGPGFAV